MEVRLLHAGGISVERHHTSIGRTTTTTSTGIKGTECLKKLLMELVACSLVAVDYRVLMLVVI